jgi:hypothetical protein
VCAGRTDAGQFRPAWCGKKPPPKSYEKFRKALAAFQANNTWLVESIATAIGNYQPVNYKCKDNPPVDGGSIDLIAGGMRLNGGAAKERAEQALTQVNAVIDTVFTDSPTPPAEVKAVVSGLRAKMDEFGRIMDDLDMAGDLYKVSACNAGEDKMVQASDDLVVVGQFTNHSVVSLATMLGRTQERCRTTKVTDPFTDRAMRNAAGATKTRKASAGDLSFQYPNSLDASGKVVLLPINLMSKAPSGYIQVEVTQGSKDLAAVGGGTPAGASGLRIKVLSKPKRGKATLRVMFQTAGGPELSRAVGIKIR